MDGSNPIDTETLKNKIIEALQTCYDPEIPVNIYELGLIYDVEVKPDGKAHIRMTLTSPNCPVAVTLPQEVHEKTKAIPGITEAKVEMVWDPPWDPSRMSEEARLELGMI